LKIKLLLLFFLIFTESCSIFQTILSNSNSKSIQVEKFNLKSISLRDMNFIGTVKIKNPYPVTVPTSDLKVKVFIENINISNIRINIKQIEESSFQTGEFEILIPYQELIPILKKIPDKNYFTIRLDGILQIPIPKAYRITSTEFLDFNFTESKNIPIFIPLISIENFKINENSVLSTISGMGNNILSGNSPLSNSSLQLDFDLLINNSYASKFKIGKLNYNLVLSDKSFITSSSSDIINNGIDSRLHINSKIEPSAITKSALEFIKKRSTSYKLISQGNLKFKDLDENVEYFFEKEGILSW
jgi:LEA14-like dessication related protein